EPPAGSSARSSRVGTSIWPAPKANAGCSIGSSRRCPTSAGAGADRSLEQLETGLVSDEVEPSRALAARGAIPHGTSLGLSADGFVAEPCGTSSTAAWRLLALDENPGARSRDGLRHGLLVPVSEVLSKKHFSHRGLLVLGGASQPRPLAG